VQMHTVFKDLWTANLCLLQG